MRVPKEHNLYLNNYIYDIAIFRGANDRLIKHLAATPVYVARKTEAKAGPAHHMHIYQRALGVLLHKLNVRPR